YLLGEVPDKAADYSWKAAERATAIHAHVEALRLAEQALELYEKLDRFPEAIKALYLIARVRRFRGENDAALSAYERALATLEARDPKSPEVGTVIAHMAELCTRWDAKHPDLDGLIARGLAIVDGQRNREKVLLLAAKSFMSRKRPKPADADWQESLATAKEALAIAEELGLLREVSLCLDAVGYAYGELGNFRESYAHNQRRLPIAKSLQDSDELIDTHNMIAVSALVLGDFHEAIEHATAGRDLALETEKPRLGAVSLQMETLGRLLAGDFVGVLAAARWRIEDQPFVERIEAVVERTGHARGRALLTQAAGVRAMQRGELAKAEKLVFDAIQAFGTLRLDYERAVALADHARVLTALGRAEHRQESDEAKAIAERLGAVALRNAVEVVAVAI